MKKPYVQSNYKRIDDDDYKTIDPRCVQALMETQPVWGYVIDCCAPSGSGIVEELCKRNVRAVGMPDAFGAFHNPDWIVTNPPYTKKVVDEIVWHQIQRIELGNVLAGVCILVRNNWDFAKSRYSLFTHPFYLGQIHMMFRPLWIKGKKKHEPIHNYVWHIWRGADLPSTPSVWYWRETK